MALKVLLSTSFFSVKMESIERNAENYPAIKKLLDDYRQAAESIRSKKELELKYIRDHHEQIEAYLRDSLFVAYQQEMATNNMRTNNYSRAIDKPEGGNFEITRVGTYFSTASQHIEHIATSLINQEPMELSVEPEMILGILPEISLHADSPESCSAVLTELPQRMYQFSSAIKRDYSKGPCKKCPPKVRSPTKKSSKHKSARVIDETPNEPIPVPLPPPPPLRTIPIRVIDNSYTLKEVTCSNVISDQEEVPFKTLNNNKEGISYQAVQSAEEEMKSSGQPPRPDWMAPEIYTKSLKAMTSTICCIGCKEVFKFCPNTFDAEFALFVHCIEKCAKYKQLGLITSCTQCGCKFLTRNALSNHLRTCHLFVERASAYIPVATVKPYCNKVKR